LLVLAALNLHKQLLRLKKGQFLTLIYLQQLPQTEDFVAGQLLLEKAVD
jgi:hypothetical protein